MILTENPQNPEKSVIKERKDLDIPFGDKMYF